ncbi:hypothetical protein [Magnetospirillum moscoviense]|uniref:hypothetical protein n=1 Tax=Magnetospirillum moscoviense TaxID=1437059 RepID=UPI000AEBA94A|nr:hypothetical protein [Magnetospirillum moscoviense]
MTKQQTASAAFQANLAAAYPSITDLFQIYPPSCLEALILRTKSLHHATMIWRT